MRIIYGDQVNTVVDDSTAPADIMDVMKDTYSELSNGQYNVTTEGGEQVMRITLRSGSKA